MPSGGVFHGVEAATGQPLEPAFRASDAGAVDRAATAAAQAFETYRSLSGARRAEFLDAIAQEIEALGDLLLERASAETALPLPRLSGERGRTCGQLRMFAAHLREGSWVTARIDRAQPDRQPLPKVDVRSMRVALGPVAVFGASNFPLAYSVAGGDTASALAAGCPVVVKAHPAHPGTSELVARAVLRAAEATGMPAGVFSMVHGAHETGHALVMHPSIEAVGFTGSLAGGRALHDAAATRDRPIPVFAEMGSINPVFVLDSALEGGIEAFATGYAGSLALGVGQFCTNPGLLVGLVGEHFDEALARIAALVDASPAGTMLTEGIARNYERCLERWSGHPEPTLSRRGASGGVSDGRRATGALFEVEASAFLEAPDLADEVFGPAALAVRARTPEEMARVARSLPGQLTSTVHASNTDPLGAELFGILTFRAGRVLWGGYPTGVEVCPSMQHGGPYPASTDSRFTSVGTAAIDRFVRPVAFQNVPDALLPEALRDANPLGLWRLEDGAWVGGGRP